MPTGQLEPLVRRLRQAAALDATAGLTDGQLLANFAARRDEAAFTTLVRRHGRLVLSVCRRVLRDRHAADDAFQATFLVLARKAGSLAEPELLGHWLYGVACRTAARARAEAARRRARERRAAPATPVGPDDGPVWRDLRPVLDEEVSRLPARHRAAVVLCYLEGQTNAEAARRLGCSRGTVATLLARARARLRLRLTRRGLALPAGLLAAALARQAAGAGVPAALESATAKAAGLFAAGQGEAAGFISAHAVSLAKGVARAMLVKKLKVVGALILVVSLAGAGLGTYRAVAEQPGAAAERPAPRRAGEDGRAPVPPPPALATASYRTTNFEVTASTRQTAEQVARAAERNRKALALLWLGREMPAWAQPCPVRVTVTAKECGQATSFQFERGRVVAQSMILEGPLDRILADLLPHEVTHTVLAHHFGGPVPRWADEGAAMLSEIAPARALRERSLRAVLDEGRAWPLRRLLPLRDYPKDVVAFYAQGYSVTEFLVRSGGRTKFLAFLARGDRDGWDKAATAQYGYPAVEDLERAWLAAVREGLRDERRSAGGTSPKGAAADQPGRSAPRPAPDEPRGRLPSGPAPTQALVKLERDGRLTVWQRAAVYRPRTITGPGGRPVTTYYEQVFALVEASYPLKDVQVQDTGGKDVEPRELRRLLKGETLALVALNGRPVDPLHLRLVKEGTLIVVLPPPAAVPPPHPPAPPAPPAAGPVREAPLVPPPAPAARDSHGDPERLPRQK